LFSSLTPNCSLFPDTFVYSFKQNKLDRWSCLRGGVFWSAFTLYYRDDKRSPANTENGIEEKVNDKDPFDFLVP
jgi:hypothetical protein